MIKSCTIEFTVTVTTGICLLTLYLHPSPSPSPSPAPTSLPIPCLPDPSTWLSPMSPYYKFPTSPTTYCLLPPPLYISPASPIPLPIPYLPAPSTRLSPSSPPICRGMRRRNVNTTTTEHSSCVPQYLITVEMVELKLHRQRQHCMFILNDG